jgi:hypothetical protein
LGIGGRAKPLTIKINLLQNINKSLGLGQIPWINDLWSLTLRDEHRLRVFENKVLRRIFGPKRDEVTGGWRKLHNEEFQILYSCNQVEEDEMDGTCRPNGGKEKCVWVISGKGRGKKTTRKTKM